MELQYVDNTTLRSIQLTEFEIAREVKRICDEEGIQYFLDGGTLLGAIRHKGFIPWDDDMDIGMLQEDYNKFIEIAPSKLADRFFLQTWDTDDEFPHAYAKVRKKGTVLKEISSKEDLRHNEIWIDIFTYHSFPEKKLERKIQGMWLTWYKDALLMKKKVAMWKYHKNKIVRLCFYFKYIPPKIYAQIHSSDFLKKKVRDWLSKYDSEKTDFVFDNGPLKYGKAVIHRNCFDSFLIKEFENEKFKIPIGYDQYLKDLYGDYMTLPPENKRLGHHITEVKV